MSKYIVALFAALTLVTSAFAGTGHSHPKNELYFLVPVEFLAEMEIDTLVTAKDSAGVYSIPNEAFFKYEGKDAVFLKVDTNKFAVRTLIVDSKTETHSSVTQNVHAGERIVTEGVPALEKGLERKTSDKSKGHSHGAGGHTH